jgi:fumarylacetoacetate (FAA) hydrolase family protein
MFSPVQNRYGRGQGFSLQVGYIVTIFTPEPGALTNTVWQEQRQFEAKCPRR